MTSAPFPTIDATGVVSWTNPASPPAQWVLETRLYDASSSSTYQYNTQIAGSNTAFDAYSASWPGGMRVVIFGVDADGNETFAPTVSNTLTKDQ